MPNARRFRRWRCRRGCRGVRSVRTRPMHLHGPRCASCNENDDSCSSRGAVRRRRGGRESKQLFGVFRLVYALVSKRRIPVESDIRGIYSRNYELSCPLRIRISALGGSVRPRAVGSRLAVERLSCRWLRFDFERRARRRDGRVAASPLRTARTSRAPFASSFDRQHTMAPPGGRPATAKGSARDKHVTFSEPSRGERGSLRRVPTGGAGRSPPPLASRPSPETPPARHAIGQNLVAPVSASLESLECVVVAVARAPRPAIQNGHIHPAVDRGRASRPSRAPA